MRYGRALGRGLLSGLFRLLRDAELRMMFVIRYLVLLGASGAIAAFMLGRVGENRRPIDDAEILSDSQGEAASAVAEFAPAPSFEPPALELMSEAFQRPLFRPDRRPPAEDLPSAEVMPDRAVDATLVGILFSDAERVALLAPDDGSDPVRVLEDEEYRGWRLVEIRPESAIFRRDDETLELRLLYKGQNIAAEPVEPTR